ncbi:MAG: rhamnan synthesis F family protein [Planctomycetota bacterium]
MPRAIILAHHDRDSLIDPHVVHALRRYRQVADRLVVVSTSAEALPAALAGCVDTFISRPNVGYDFCSWQAGLAALGDPGAFAEVILVNDSVYGPLTLLSPVLADPRLAEADLWGMVLSDQAPRRRGKRVCPHLQSWFLAARRPLLESEVWRRFWQGVEPLPSKDAVIDRYEIGLTEQVAAAGFRIAALYNASQAGPLQLREIWPHLSLAEPARSWRHFRKARRTPHNPSELAWRRLLEAGVPYVKVGLFRVNHYGLDLARVRADLSRDCAAGLNYDLPLIENHLSRLREG